MQINTLAQDHRSAVVVGDINLVLVANFDDMKSATLKMSGLKRLKMLALDHGNEGFPCIWRPLYDERCLQMVFPMSKINFLLFCC